MRDASGRAGGNLDLRSLTKLPPEKPPTICKIGSTGSEKRHPKLITLPAKYCPTLRSHIQAGSERKLPHP